MILERGTLLNNRYRIIEILGQGGMGSVYRAIDENLGVEVAVKDNLFTTEEYARQFRREALILANLRHPNLPRVTDHFVIEKQGQYLVMDYIEGEDLRQRMERVNVLQDEEVIVIGAAVCDALTYLGTRKPPVIHRDIKPGNVKITPQGQIFLVDFGLAKTLQGSQATTTGARAMTPGFSPPEQYGTARTDQRSDIFSLGATLFAALTGATPEDALARAMDQAELTLIRKHNPRVSRKLAGAIEKALEVRPEDRYQTAEEFKQALLGSSSSTKRRESSDFVVAPAPVGENPIPAEEAQPPAVSPPKSFSKAASILPVSTPIEEIEQSKPRSRPKKRKRGIGCWLTILILLGLIGGGGYYIYRYDPALPARVMAQLPVVYLPVLATATETAPMAIVDTPTQPAPASTFTPTHTIVAPTHTPTPTPTQLLTPTKEPQPTDTPTPLPTPLGGGTGQITFASDESGAPQIYSINSDGSGQRQIINMREGACQPDWSPDSKRLVFISPCDGNGDYYPGAAMFIVNEDGSGLLPLPSAQGGDFDPKWSPDGNKIVFTSLRNSGRMQVYVLDLADNSVTGLSDKYSVDYQADWSKDGKQLIFLSTRHGGQQIWIMDADGKNQMQYSNNPLLLFSHPSWSPDMANIVFTQVVSAAAIPRVALAPYSIESFEPYRLGQESLPMRDAVFSPDGYWLAFEGWEVGGSHNIYIMTATGAGATQVTLLSRQEFDPVWRP